MIKQIQLRGISRTPSDRMSEDGGLSESLNMYLDTAENAPAFVPKDVTGGLGLPADLQAERIFIHKTANYENYIVVQEGKIVAYTSGIEDEEPLLVMELAEGERVNDITSVGNTLVVSASHGTYYVLYSRQNYSFLGDNIPFPTIEIFDVQTPIVQQQKFDTSSLDDSLVESTHSFKIDPVYPEDLYSDEGAKAVSGLYYYFAESPSNADVRDPGSGLTEKLWNDLDSNGYNKNEGVRKIFNEIQLKYNEMVAHNAELGIMCYPVWAVYAIRLFDGSLKVSMPFLISGGLDTPIDVFAAGLYPFWGTYLMRLNHYYKIGLKLYDYAEENVKQWKDVIKGIEIYISENINPLDWKSIQISHREVGTGDPDNYVRAKFKISGYSGKYEEFAESCSVFNKIATFSIDATYYPSFTPSIDEIREDYIIDMKGKIKNEDRLDHLLSNEVHSFSSHAISGNTTQYNGRLVFVNAQEIIDSGARWLLGQRFNSHIPRPIFYTNTYTPIDQFPSWWKENPLPLQEEIKEETYEFVYHISSIADRNVVYGQTVNGLHFTPSYQRYQYKPVVFLLSMFPNADCTKVEIWTNGKGTSFSMTPHVSIPQTMRTYGGPLYKELSGTLSNKAEENKTIDISNKVLVSLVDNPFIIPEDGIFTFQSKVIGVAVATTALSQGQFGQFPLYVFTEDGIWAMETGADGSFVSQKPLSREVCNNPDSITSIDNAVVFTTDKAVMMIQGSQVMNISPYMNGRHYTPNESALNIIGKQEGYDTFVDVISDDDPFMSFMKDAKVAYDYTGQRLVFISPSNNGFQYVYKIDTQTWHKVAYEGLDLEAPLNSYPECLVYSVNRKEYKYEIKYKGESLLASDEAIKSLIDDLDWPGLHKPSSVESFKENWQESWRQKPRIVKYAAPADNPIRIYNRHGFTTETLDSFDVGIRKISWEAQGFGTVSQQYHEIFCFMLNCNESELTEKLSSLTDKTGVELYVRLTDETGEDGNRVWDADFIAALDSFFTSGYKKDLRYTEASHQGATFQILGYEGPDFSSEVIQQLAEIMETDSQEMASAIQGEYIRTSMDANKTPEDWDIKVIGEKKYNSIVSLSTVLDAKPDLENPQKVAKGILITRPFDLGEPDVYKTIKAIKIRGDYDKGNVKYLLQGSDDGKTFYTLSSMRGKSWKMFRLFILADLEPTERISWVDIEYETRFKNRLR